MDNNSYHCGSMSLTAAMSRCRPNVRFTLGKYFRLSGVTGWDDLTRTRYYDIRDAVMNNVSANSARQYFAQICAFLDRYREDMNLCTDYTDILTCRAEASQKVYLTPKELKRLEAVTPRTRRQAVVHHQFIIGAYTGLRISDIRTLDDLAVKDGTLTYVSHKTRVEASVPVSGRVAEYINDCRDEEPVSTSFFNEAIQAMCKEAGIDTKVRVYRHGRYMDGPKWEFVTSHTARVSFCTNLANAGVPLFQIARMAGHRNTLMTERYIVGSDVRLGRAAMAYLTQE